jgi:hypothetical protein
MDTPEPSHELAEILNNAVNSHSEGMDCFQKIYAAMMLVGDTLAASCPECRAGAAEFIEHEMPYIIEVGLKEAAKQPQRTRH